MRFLGPVPGQTPRPGTGRMSSRLNAPPHWSHVALSVPGLMYTTTLVVRSILSIGLAYLAVSTGDPFFAVVLAVVLFGVALTGVCYLLDRREAEGRAQSGAATA